MRVINLMWGFNLGGVGKCFLIYGKLGKVAPELEVKSVVINLQNIKFDLTPLQMIDTTILNIRNRWDFSWIFQLKKIFDDFQPDAVFTHAFNGPVVVMIERLLYHKKLKFLCSYHGQYHAPTRFRKLLQPLFNGMMLFIYRYFADGVTTVCDFCKDFLVNDCRLTADKITTIYNGICDICPDFNCVAFSTPRKFTDERPFILGVASRLDPVKGISYLLEALTLLEDIPVHLFVVGDGPCRRELEKLAIEKHLNDRVEFVGFQSDISFFLKQFDVFLLPSLSEYHSISLLEAMSFGKTIIATDVGGNHESVRDHQEGLLVPSCDSRAIASAIRFLYENHDIRLQLGLNARKRFLQLFTEDCMMRNLSNWILSFQ